VLRETMEEHLARPRVLEDALCAMSNIAYSTDASRLHVGRSSASIIVQVLRVFNADPYLFSMALRAVGNLTRCDENIVSVVGQGVIEGMVEGMKRNMANKEVLRLAADVVGNLASIDEGAIDRREGMKALRLGMAQRGEKMPASTTAREAASVPTAGGAKGSTPAKKADSVSLQDAVVGWLLTDGAHVGLCEAMVAHNDDAELVSACLRSLQYMSETRAHVERMESGIGLAAKTCLVMRSCDFDAELCVRGSLLLAQLLRHSDSFVHAAAVEAGAAQVLLSVLDTHQHDFEVVSNIAKVLLLLGPGTPAFTAAARELHSPGTLLRIIEAARGSIPRTAGSAAGGSGTPRTGKAGAAAAAAKGKAAAASTPGIPAAADRDAEDAVSHRKVSDLSAEESHLLIRQSLAILAAWAVDPALAAEMAVPAVGMAVDLLLPTSSRLYSDGVLLEAITKLLQSVATSGGPATGAALANAGIMRLYAPIPTVPGLLDRPQLISGTLALLDAIGKAGPEAALTVMEGNAHAVCQGVAVHWALKSGEEAPRRAVYETAGDTLRTLCDASLGLRRQRAVAEARATLEAIMAGGAAGGPVSVTGGGEWASSRSPRAGAGGAAGATSPTSRSGGASAAAGVQATSIKELLADETVCVKTARKRQEEAAAVARALTKKASHEEVVGADGEHHHREVAPADVLELRAGLIPWELFPRAGIEALAASETKAEMWFLPSMCAEKRKKKLRRMNLALSTDLRRLTWSYESRHYKRVMEWTIALQDVARVRVGDQVPHLKHTLFGKNPDPAHGVCLDAPSGLTLFHAELSKPEEHDGFLRTLAVLAQYARARTGVQELMPELPEPYAVSYAALLHGSGEDAVDEPTHSASADGGVSEGSARV